MERGSIYPSWRYHADGRSTLCLTRAQDAELGNDWSDADIRGSHPDAPVVEELVDAAPKKRGRPAKVN